MSAQIDPKEFEGIDVDEITNPQFTQLYLAARNDFRTQVKRARRVSMGAGHIYTEDMRTYWASILFTRIAVMAKSIEKLLPDCRPREHWDFSSVASLTRNLSESYLYYFWLCLDDVSENEREARLILLKLHDHGSRKKLFPAEFEKEDPDNKIGTELTKLFDKNSALNSLPEKRQKELKKGQKTPFLQDDVIERIDFDKDEFRMIYRFLSQHTHSSPVSFYRMAESDRGTGVETRTEKAFHLLAIGTAGLFLDRAIQGHKKLFPDCETRTPPLTESQIVHNVEVAQGRKKRVK